VTRSLRIGTRGSPLALAQTDLVVRALGRARPELRCEILTVRTSGDRSQRTTGSLDFTDEITRRLRRGLLDLGVHSAKDLGARANVTAYLPRGDPRDCLVLRRKGSLRTLPRGARLGSSSLRRRAQLMALRPDLEIVPIRGNVGSRIERMVDQGLDGVVLAAVGLRRLGSADRISELLPTSTWLPAPGQGAIAIEVRDGARTAREAARALDHRPTRAAVEAERAVVRSLGGDCDLPLGAFARVRRAGHLELRAALFSSDGRVRFGAERTGSFAHAGRVGTEVGRSIRSLGDPERWSDAAGHADR
jgi:hydroxymethylbilane synthase